MTSTLEDSDAEILRKKERRDARRARERANRIGTNLKPHLRELIDEEAVKLHVPQRTCIRILLCEALEARGHNLVEALRDWKERNPNETDDDED
jgi:hypothetical protein